MEHNLSDSERLIKLRNRLVLTYTVTLVIISICICIYNIVSYNRSMQEQATEYAATISMQLQKNVNNFLNDIENASKIIYIDQSNLDYRPSSNEEKTYEEMLIEQDISDQLMSISFMKNYCDFAIVYENGQSVGTISDGTLDIFGKELFSSLYEKAKSSAHSVWITNVNGSYSRLYCAKMIDDDAILLTSIYTAELDKVFEKPDKSSEIMIYLIENGKNVLYASENTGSLYGENLSDELVSVFTDCENVTIVDDKYTGAVSMCKNNWKVICYSPKADILSLHSDENTWLLTAGFVIIVVFISLGFLASSKYTSENSESILKRLRNKANVDEVTGLLNSLGVEDGISEQIETCMTGSTFGFIIIKIKDFEDIRNRLGVVYADKALTKLADYLTDSFNSNDIIGINEKNEFIAFADFSDFDLFKAHNMLKDKCNSLVSDLKNFYAGDEEEHKLYVAIGACVYPDNGKTFDELYDNTVRALEISLESDKEDCVFFDSINKHKGGGK